MALGSSPSFWVFCRTHIPRVMNSRKSVWTPINAPQCPPAVCYAGGWERSAGAAPPRNPSSSNYGNTIRVVCCSNKYNQRGGAEVRHSTTWTLFSRPTNVGPVRVAPKRRRR